jgi:hypothetical protein
MSTLRRILIITGVLVILAGAGWLVHAWSVWQTNVKTDKFNSDVENLFVALQQYKEHVGAYPLGGNAEVVKSLNGKNAKNLIILIGRKNDLNEKGEFVDPWGTPLRIYFSDSGVLVRSAGANRRFDDSTVLNNDDYFRSN